MVPLGMLSEFFTATVKKLQPDDEDGTYHNTCVINMIKIKHPRTVDIFQQYLMDFDLSAELLAGQSYRVTVKTKKTIRELLNYVNLFCLYNVLKNTKINYNRNQVTEDYFEVNDATISKYLKCLEVVDPPYFVRYLFKIFLLRGNTMFGKHKELLQNTNQHESIELKFGDTSLGRRNAIKGHLGFLDRTIIDVGCGEGFNAFDLLKKLPSEKKYHAIDVDQECREIMKGKAEKRGFENVVIHESFDELFIKCPDIVKAKVDVLATEVIEHMPKDQASVMVRASLGAFKNLENLVITTPNRDFNKFYDLHDEMHLRHSDHHFEFTEAEFRQFIFELLPANFNYSVKFFDIGDKVNGIPTSLGVHIQKMEIENESSN
jgi:2-polyprenyl-3-methyl-5-hydroxy-6-metoxy-1,4-benzoquinol methylase